MAYAEGVVPLRAHAEHEGGWAFCFILAPDEDEMRFPHERVDPPSFDSVTEVTMAMPGGAISHRSAQT